MINEDDDDFLNAARRERGALPAGEYVAEIVPGSVVPFDDASDPSAARSA